MRVFISYGRADAADLAVKLAGWLRARGYEPWLDVENGIPIGHPFDIMIEEGIASSRMLIALLSPWSLRPEGFCRNEILYAQAMKVPIIPVRVGEVVPPIQVISLNYVDAWPSNDILFGELPKHIEQVAATGRSWSRDWAEAQPRRPWWAEYRKLNFEEELAAHGGTGLGREWLFVKIREWLSQSCSRVLLLTGPPGIGKSWIAAHMTARLNVRGVHFCSRSNAESCRPNAWLSGLVYQLAAQFPAFREKIERMQPPNWGENAEHLFRHFIADPLRECKSELDVSEPWVFVVDGLDESVAVVRDPLADMADMLARAAHRIPDWLRLVVTSRPDEDILARFKLEGIVERFHLKAESGQNRSDLRAYVERRLSGHPGLRAATARRLEEVAAGNFQFASVACNALTMPDSGYSLGEGGVAAIPPGLDGLYYAMFANRFQNMTAYESTVLPILNCLVVARAPLSEGFLVRAIGAGEHAVRKGLLILSQFLRAGQDGTRLFHQSVEDWLTDSHRSGRFVASPQDGHRRLADSCWSEYRSGVAAMSGYSRAHLASHLLAVGRWAELRELATDPGLRLISRWVEGEDGDIGVACLTGLIRYLEQQGHGAVTAAGIATQLARIYSIRGNYSETEEWLKWASGRTSWLRGRRIRAIALHELGSLALYRGEHTQSARRYRQALIFCQAGIPVYHDEAAANLIGLATVAQAQNEYLRIMRLANRALKHAVQSRDATHTIAAHRLLGTACKYLGRYAEAESHIETGLLLCEVVHLSLEKMRLLLLRGWLEYDLATVGRSLFHKAQESFAEALREAQVTGNLYSMVESQVGLGSCALAEMATSQAEASYAGLESVIQSGELPELRAAAKLGLAAVLQQQGKLEAAQRSYEEVLKFCEANNFLSGRWKSLIALGGIQWHLGSHREAEKCWNCALALGASISPSTTELVRINIDLCRSSPLRSPR